MAMARDLTLSIDVGTGSVRAALVDGSGAIVHITAREHDQIVPAFGWAEQRPEDWWTGVVHTVRAALSAVPDARDRIAAVAACGQMHGTVLVDDDGRVLRETAPLWNDKRTVDLVAAFERDNDPSSYLADTANPPTPAWPGFKLAWLREHDPVAFARTRAVLMPKDFVNLRLTGRTAMDPGDASLSFLMDPRTGDWSAAMIARLGLPAGILPPIRDPLAILGAVTAKAASETGLPEGLPVLVGGADYPVAVLGSGAIRPGLASDVTGTSCILTMIADAPILDPEICNIATIEGHWGPFVLLETGGDAMRWARRAFHERSLSYDDIVAKAAEAPAGSDGLFFLPYLTGERLGAHRNARAQFFGLGAAHGLPHLHRAVAEGDGGRGRTARREGDRLRRRRQDGPLAEDQGQHLRRAGGRPARGGVRRDRLRGDGRDGDRSVLRPSVGDRRLRAPRRRDRARPGLGRALRPDAAGVRPHLHALPGALRRPRRAVALTGQGKDHGRCTWNASASQAASPSSPARRAASASRPSTPSARRGRPSSSRT
jgi:xylulokinase